ncbi:MAG: hypothetical protein LBI65_01190, partial [Candidatus Symbiothrix sp.]|nr:hypothetical protein [Candidatus Symbiothrix sp.]
EGTDEYIRYQEELEKITLKSTQDKEKAEADREEKIKALIEKYDKEAAVTDAQKKQQEIDSLNELFAEELRNTEQYLQLKQAIEDKYRKKEVRESIDPVISDNKNFKKKEKTPQSFGDLNAEAKALKTAKEAELAIIDAAEASGLLSEIDFQEQRQMVLDKYNALEIEKDREKQQAKMEIVKFGLGQVSTLMDAASSYLQASQQAEEAAVSAKYDKEIKAAGNNQKKVKKLEEQKEKELAKVRAEASKKTFALQAAQVVASTALAAINAYNAGLQAGGPAGLIAGPVAMGVAIAAGLLQLAAIKKQADAAKAGYASGGYTGEGPEDEEAGVVHRREFVANAEAVGNPDVKKFLDVFNVAQKNGSIRMINTTQILEKVKLTGGAYQSGGYTPAPAGTAPSFPDDPLRNTAGELSALYEKLMRRLDEPIEAYSVISGRNGSYNRTREYEQLLKNGSR